MKTLLIYCVIILASVTAWAASEAAPVIQWDASSGAEGYNVYCSEIPLVPPTPTDVGNVLTHDLGPTVVAGTIYECWITAYAAGFPESAESNHIQFTPPAVAETIVVPAPPSSVTISWE